MEGMNLVEKFLRIATSALREQGKPFALVGGFAIIARCQPRFTHDADIAVAVADDAEAESIILGLTHHGLQIKGVLEQTAANRLSTIRLAPPGHETTVLDLLFASSGIEREIVASAESLEIVPGLVVPVASVAALIALKVLAEAPRRAQDRNDLGWLFEVASPQDMTEAKKLLALIMERGFNRNEPLDEKFERLNAELGKKAQA